MYEIKRQFQMSHDWFRNFLLNEPRGHRDMFGAVLFPPKRAECDLGVIFMDSGGYLDMCGHGIIGVVTCAVETGIIRPKSNISVDTPAGVVKTHIDYHRGKVDSVSFQNVPAFKLETTQIEISGKSIPVDIVFGGNFFALVHSEAVGIAIEPRYITKIIDLGIRIREAVNSKKFSNPEIPEIKVELVEFSGPPKSKDADAQNVVVFGRGQIDRSPCGTGTCAKMAALYSEGMLKLQERFVHESIIGTRFSGKLIAETKVAGCKAVIPEITGSAYITGFNRLVLDEKDPLAAGFLI